MKEISQDVPRPARRDRILLYVGLAIVTVDITRLILIPHFYHTAFMDLVAAIISAIGAVVCGFAAARSSSSVGNTLWIGVATFLGLMTVADSHDFLVDMSLLSGITDLILTAMGWCVYLPLAMLIVYPTARHNRPYWSWLPIVDFLQVSLTLAIVYFSYIYLPHATTNEPWAIPKAPDLVRNVLIAGALLLRAGLDPSATARAFYRRVGGAFAVATFFRVVFDTPWHGLSIVGQALSWLALIYLAARWSETPDKVDEQSNRGAILRLALGILAATNVLVVVALAHNAPKAYAAWMGSATGVAVLLFVIRTVLAERSRHETEQELRISERDYRVLYESASVPIVIFKPEAQRILEVNRAACELYGASRQKLLGASLRTFMKNASADDAILAKLLNTGICQVYETIHQSRGGTEINIRASASVIEYRGEKAILSFHQDITEQKRDEEIIKRSSAALSEAQNLAHIGSWKWDRTTDKSEWTAEMYRIFGCDPKLPALGYEDHFKHTTEAGRAIEKAAVEQALRTGQSYEFDLEIIRSDGGHRWIVNRGIPDRDSGGHIVGLHGTVQDITERKRIEEALRESEEKFSRMFMSSPAMAAVSESDNSNRFLNVNHAFEEVTGYTRDEVVGKNAADLDLWVDSAPYATGLEELQSKKSTRREMLLRRKNGEIRTVFISAVLTKLGGRTCTLSTGIDITDHKEAEKALRESEEKFSKTFWSGPAITTISDIDDGGRLLDVNEAFERVVGYRRDEVIGKTTSDIALWAEPKERTEALARGGAHGHVRNMEMHFRKKNGEIGVGLLSAEMIELGGKRCTIATTIDITDRKRAEEDWKRTFDTVSDSVMLLDSEFRVRRANRATVDLLQLAPDQVIGRHCYELVHQTTSPPESCPVQCLLKSGKEARADVEEPRLNKNFDVIATPTHDASGRLTGCIHTIRDITERKRSEKAVRESEEKFSRAFWMAPVITSILDADDDSRALDVNEAFEKAFGWRRTEAIGKTCMEIGFFADTDECAAAKSELLAHGALFNREFRFRRRNGEIGIGLLSAQLMELQGKRRIVTTAVDITDRVRVEQALTESQNRTRRVLEGLTQGVFLKDRNCVYISVNQAYCRLLGLKIDPAEFPGKTDLDLYPAELAEKYRADDKRVMDSGQTEEIEELVPLPDGTLFEVQTVKTPFRNEKGEIIGLLGIFWDISDRKRAEAQLKFMNDAIEHSEQPFASVDPDGTLRVFNKAYERLTGYSRDELLKLTYRDLTPSRWHEMETRIVAEAMATGLPTPRYEKEYRRKDGTLVPIELVTEIHKNEQGKVWQLSGFITDLTERKRAEAEIRESEERYRSVVTAMAEGVVVQDASGKIIACNAPADRMLGLPSSKMKGLTSDEWRNTAIHEDGSPFPVEMHPAMVTLRTGKAESNVCMGLRQADGSVTWILINSEPLLHEGETTPYAVVTTFADITRRREIEEAQRRSEERLQLQFDRMPIGCITWDKNFRVQSWNPAATTIFGFTASETIGRHPYEFIVPKEAQPAIDGIFARLSQGDTAAHSVNENLTKDGRTITCRWTNTPVRDEAGQFVSILSMVEDITATKAAEDTLRRQAALIDLAYDAIFVRDMDSRIVFWSKGAERTYGWTPEEAVGKLSHELLGTQFHMPLDVVDGIVQECGFWEGELVHTKHDGTKITVDSRWSLQRDESEKATAVLEVNRDVTTRKQAETAISAERQKFNTILDSVPPYVCLLTPDYHVAFANREFRRRFGEHQGRKCYEFLFNRTEPCEVCESFKVLTDDKPRNWKWTGPDGCHYDIFDFPFIDTDGSKLILEMGIDVTEREKARTLLETERKRFESVLNGLPAMICLLTPEYEVAFANTTFRKAFGESQGRKCYEYCYGKTAPCEFCESFKVLQTGKPHDWETTRNGRHLHAFDVPFCDVDGSPLVLEMDLDVTEQRVAEEKLRRSEAELKEAQRVARLGSWTMDTKTGKVTWTEELYRMLGLDPSSPAVSYQDQARLMTPESWSRLTTELDKTMKTGTPYEVELETTLPDGGHGWMLARGEAVRKNDETSELHGIALDITERKRAEAALRDSEEKLRLAMAAGKMGAWDLDLVNDRAWRSIEHDQIFGYDTLLPEWSSQTFLEHVLPEDREMVKGKFEEAYRTGFLKLECRILRKDNTMRWIAPEGQVSYDKAGKPIRMVGVVTDITERKLAELERRRLQANIAALVESTGEMIWSVDLNFGLLTFNENLRKHLERSYGIHTALGMKPEELLPPEKAPKWTEMYRRALVEGPFRIEYESHKDLVLDLSFNPVVQDGQTIGISVFSKDITERKRSETALRESEQKFSTLVDFVPQFVWMCTPDGLNFYFNQRWFEYTGLSKEESYGRGWNTPFHPDDKQAAWDAWNRATSTGETYQVESRLRAADGSYRWFLMRGMPLRDDASKIVRWFGTCTDIHDMKLAQAALTASEAHHRSFIEHNAAGFICTTAKGTIVDCNPAAAQMFGYESPQGLVGSPAANLYFDSANRESVQRRLREDRTLANQEIFAKKKDGSPMWALVNFSVTDYQGESDYLVQATFIDITEARKAHEEIRALNESLERRVRERTTELQTFFDTVPIGLAITNDPQGLHIHGNPAIEHILGASSGGELSRSAAQCAPYRILKDGQERPPEDLPMQRAARGETVAGELMEITRADGTVITVHSVAAPLFDEQHRPRGAVGAFLDITDQKRSEEALRASEQRLATVIDNMTAGIWVVDATGKVTAKNKAADLIWKGDAPLSSRAEDYAEYVAWEAESGKRLETSDYPLARTLRTGLPVSPVELRIRRFDGSDGFVMMSTAVLKGADGALTGAVGTNVDITSRKQAEAALRDSQSRLAALLDTAPAAIAIHDASGRISNINTLAKELLGISEGIGKGLSDSAWRFLREDGSVMPEAEYPAAQVLARHEPITNLVAGIQRGDGHDPEWVLVNALPRLDANGVVTEVIVAFVSITDRKKAEAAVRESERSVRRKLDSILLPEGDLGTLELGEILDIPVIHKLLEEFYAVVHVTIGVIDLRGKILSVPAWQPACMKFHRTHPESCKNCVESDVQLSAGVPAGEFKLYKCKNNLWDAATPIIIGDQHLGNLYFGQFFFTDETVNYDIFREQAKRYGFDEQEYLKAIEAVPRISREVFDASMTFLARFAKVISQFSYSTIKLARSMTETKNVNERLAAANQELESFTYAVAHDLRAPLRHIHGFSSILAEESTELSDSGRQHLKFITDGVERMSQLLEDLLNLSRTSRQELRLQLCGIKSILDQVIKEMGTDITDRAVEWKIGKLPFANCDPALIKYVLINLLSNALKFTRTRDHAVIEIGTVQKDGDSVVFVRDNGVGFDMRYAGKMFGVFQRLHRQEDFEGTGVGLAIVQRIIRKHGGRVWAEGELNRGATFYFTLGEMQQPEPAKQPQEGELEAV